MTRPTAQPNTPPSGRVVVFRRLSARNLVFAAGFRVIGRRVVFIEPVGWLRTASWISRLAKLGIELANFHDCEGMSLSEDLRSAARTAGSITDSFDEGDYEVLRAGLPEAPLTPDKARALLFDFAFNDMLGSCEAYALAEHFRRKGLRADIFNGRSVIGAFAAPLMATDIANLRPGLPTRLIQFIECSPLCCGILLFFLRLLARLLKLGSRVGGMEPSGVIPDQRPIGRDILYFPHKGVTYGSLFVKDQYYTDDLSSPLDKHNIAHVELGWMMSPSEQTLVTSEYARLDIDPIFLGLEAQRSLVAWLETFCASYAPLSGPGRLFKSLLITILVIRFANYRKALAPCSGSRVALVGYDTLFPPLAALTLQSLGIHVAASQERFIQPFYGINALIFDTYFVHGTAVRSALAANSFVAIDRLVVTGDPRRDKISKHRTEAATERRQRFSKFRHVCLVLDFHTKQDPLDDPFHFWTDVPSNMYFYGHVAELAAANKDCAFVIRGKNADWLEFSEMAPAATRFRVLENVFIDQNYGTFDRSYVLAAMADIVVARYTSLCDQCLAEGIPVLIHDPLQNGGRLISAWHDYHPYPVFTFTRQELERRFAETIRERCYMPEHLFTQMRKYYYEAEIEDHFSSAAAKIRADLVFVLKNSAARTEKILRCETT